MLQNIKYRMQIEEYRPLGTAANALPPASLMRGTFILLNLDVNSSLKVKLSESVIPFPFESFFSTFNLGVQSESKCLRNSPSAMLVALLIASKERVALSLKSIKIHI